MRSLNLVFSVSVTLLLLGFSSPSAEAQKDGPTGPVHIRFISAVADTDHDKPESPAAAPGTREYLLQQLDKGLTLPRRPTKQVFLSAVMETPGPGKGAWTRYKARTILGSAHERIAVEAAFPNQDPRGEPIVVQGLLKPDD